jgi:hypothetical protein
VDPWLPGAVASAAPGPPSAWVYLEIGHERGVTWPSWCDTKTIFAGSCPPRSEMHGGPHLRFPTSPLPWYLYSREKWGIAVPASTFSRSVTDFPLSQLLLV